MKGQDIVILLKLICLKKQEEEGNLNQPARGTGVDEPYSIRGLAASLGISKTEVHASINRSLFSGLAIKDRITGRIRPNHRALGNFITHGLKYVFPVKPGGITRGIPTAFAAPMLNSLLISPGEYIYIWPDAEGKIMGQFVEPLFKSVPEAVKNDEQLYEYLALIDAIRLGRPREAGLAAKLLEERLLEK